MYPVCAWWVFGSLSPVSLPVGWHTWRIHRCSVLFLGVVRSAESRVRWQPSKPVKTLRTKHQNIVKIRRNVVEKHRNIVGKRRNVVEKRRNS